MIRKIIAAKDGGYGNYKIAWRNGDGNIHTASIPADVGIGQTDLGLLATGMEGKYSQVKPHIVECGGVRYLVGNNVHRWSSRVYERRTDYQRLGDAPETRPLTYAVLAEMLDDIAEAEAKAEALPTTANGRHATTLPILGATDEDSAVHLSLVIGLPVEVMQDKPRAQATLAALKKWLIGFHSFRVDGRDYALHIDRVAVMAQPLGTYAAWGYRPDGTWGRSEEDFNAPVAVVDIGYNTLDLFGIERGQLIGHLTGGQDLGLHRAAETIVQEVRAAYGVELSTSEADGMIREHTKSRAVMLHTSTATHNINHIVQQALDLCFAGVSEFLRKHCRPGDYRYLLFGGGGVQPLRQQLLRQYPAAIIPADPVTSNADGLARRALWYFAQSGKKPAALMPSA
jgi:hypothetical protein